MNKQINKQKKNKQKRKRTALDRMKRHRVRSGVVAERRPLYFLEAGPIGDFEVDKSQLISGA